MTAETHPQEEIDTVKVNPDDLRAIAESATPGPWYYRPRPLDDWGYVRASMDADQFMPIIATARAGHGVTDDEFAHHRIHGTDPYGHNANFIAAFNPSTCLALLDERDGLKARVESAEKEKDVAQSTVTAWLGVFECIEAHLMDRIAMGDAANPQRYLDIIRNEVGNVGRTSEQIAASRWADYNRHLESIAFLESQLSTIRKEATDAERERAAGIAERKGDLADGRRRGAMLISDFTRADQEFKACLIALEIAQAIRAPTGDEGK